MLSSITKSADEVLQLLSPISQLASQIVIISGRIDAKIHMSTSMSMLNLTDSHESATDWFRRQLQSNNTVMSSLMDSMASNHRETMSRFDKIEESLDEQVRPKILSWLSGIPYRQHHKTACSEILKGTGSWFLEDSVYLRWRDSHESAMLWIRGIPGSGKSKLVYVHPRPSLYDAYRVILQLQVSRYSRSAGKQRRITVSSVFLLLEICDRAGTRQSG